jgi:hypothetical protein
MSKEEVETLLKRGILGFIENKTDEEQFFGQDIDQIIEKSGRKVEYTLGQNYAYSKSKFAGDHSSSQLDINAADFWEVALRDIQSPVQKLNAKAGRLEDYATAEQQEALMLEITQIVSEFVKTRVSGGAFNAEDERILSQLLNRISSDRFFNRQYRQIADKLIEEIEKPSRRFKVTPQLILAVRGGRGQPA